MHMKEEYNMATAENVTLKKLVQAKDVILIQKSQIIANIRVGCWLDYCLRVIFMHYGDMPIAIILRKE